MRKHLGLVAVGAVLVMGCALFLVVGALSFKKTAPTQQGVGLKLSEPAGFCARVNNPVIGGSLEAFLDLMKPGMNSTAGYTIYKKYIPSMVELAPPSQKANISAVVSALAKAATNHGHPTGGPSDLPHLEALRTPGVLAAAKHVDQYCVETGSKPTSFVTTTTG